MAKKQSPSTLLWFIRRKAYVPICEIRRRFELDGDEGCFLEGDGGNRVFLGLPPATTGAVEKLWKQGKIGLELSVEFDCRVVIGVYPMVPLRDPVQPVARPKRQPAVTIVPPPSDNEPPTVVESDGSASVAAGS